MIPAVSYRVYYVPDTAFGTLQILIHLILAVTYEVDTVLVPISQLWKLNAQSGSGIHTLSHFTLHPVLTFGHFSPSTPF